MKKKVLVIMAAALMLNVMNVSVYAETNEAIEKSFEDTETIKKVQELFKIVLLKSHKNAIIPMSMNVGWGWFPRETKQGGFIGL